MKTRLFLFSPKLKLALSTVLLAFALCFLWSSTYFAMPTVGLALHKSAAESFLPLDTLKLYSPPPEIELSYGRHWYFLRQEDDLYLLRDRRDASLLWGHSLGMYYRMPDYSPFLLDYEPFYGRGGKECVTLVTASDPAVSRIVLTAFWRPSKEWVGTEEELISNYSATADCVQVPPGSGFWVCTQMVPDGPSTAAHSFSTLVRAYGEDGTLLYETPAE